MLLASVKGAGTSWALYVENRNQNTYRRYSGALKSEGKKTQNSDHELNSWPQTWERHINYIAVVSIPSSTRNPQKPEARAMFKTGNVMTIHENQYCASRSSIQDNTLCACVIHDILTSSWQQTDWKAVSSGCFWQVQTDGHLEHDPVAHLLHRLPVNERTFLRRIVLGADQQVLNSNVPTQNFVRSKTEPHDNHRVYSNIN